MGLGHHIHCEIGKYESEFEKNIKFAEEYGARISCAQIFLLDPKSAKLTATDADLDSMREYSKSMNIYVHSTYVANPWGKNKSWGIKLIKTQLQLCDKINSAGLVVHIPKNTPEEIASIMPDLLKGTNAPLYLEVNALKASDTSYESPPKLIKLLNTCRAALKPDQKSRVRLCLDTAHLWANGKDIRDYDSMDIFMQSLERPFLIHLNDQIHELGSGRDEHAPLCYGTIWNEYSYESGKGRESGLASIIDNMDDIDCILERRADKPKINGEPVINNIASDYLTLFKLGYKQPK